MFSKILNVNLCYWKFLLLLCYNSVIGLFHPKSGRAAGKSTTFWLFDQKWQKWSIFRPSDHFFFFSKSGRSGDQATTSGRSPKKWSFCRQNDHFLTKSGKKWSFCRQNDHSRCRIGPLPSLLLLWDLSVILLLLWDLSVMLLLLWDPSVVMLLCYNSTTVLCS